MMKKILFFAVLVIALFLVSCAPQLTKEEVLEGLDDLSEEELNVVLAEDSGAVAGQAYVTPQLKSLKTAVKYYFTWLSCTDSDGGVTPELKGLLKALYDDNGKTGSITYEDVCLSEKSLKEYYCNENKFAYQQVECEFGCLNGACQTAVCGNGLVEAPEQCDDGNTQNLDGCDASCKFEGNIIDVVDLPVCGDSLVQGTEQCDDGNQVSGDWCSATCQKENVVNQSQN